MIIRYSSLVLILSLFFQVSLSQRVISETESQRVTFIARDAENRIDIMAGGKLFTSYRWPGNVYKPILYPVYATSGTEVTRGFPLAPREGERNDHIHQAGIWLTYGNINGTDFWGTGHTGAREPGNGVIAHRSVEGYSEGDGEGILIATAAWVMPSGKEILTEKTELHFIAGGSLRIIDRITTLTATDTTVVFGDTKEGMFGMRVARPLELPSKEMVILLDASGNPSKTKVSAATGATGSYTSSKGLQDDAVWGTRADWMRLSGSIRDEKISIVICDHPENPGYPTYWHARGYGLFAANPLGWKDFTGGKEVLGFTLRKGDSVTFRYRVIISSGSFLEAAGIEKMAKEFTDKY